MNGICSLFLHYQTKKGVTYVLYKRVESEIFAIFPLEVTKTSFTTNCDHPNN